MDKRDQILTLMHHLNFMFSYFLIEKRLLNFQNQLSFLINFNWIIYHLGTNFNVIFITVQSTFSG